MTKKIDLSTIVEVSKYSIPSIIGMLIVSFQMVIDGMFVSRGVGHLGLAAVNLSIPLINVLLSVAIMIISGGVVLAGVAKGKGDEEQERSCVTLTFTVLLSVIIFMSLMLMLNINRICVFLGADEEVFSYTREYLSIIVGGFIFYCIPNFTEAFSRLHGFPNLVFISGIICCVVNVVLDYFFVLKFNWGLTGAAVATCIANTTAAIVLLPKVKFGKLHLSFILIKKMFFNGSSEFFTSVSAAISMVFINIVLMQRIGAMGVAAFTIVNYVNLLITMSMFGLSQALYPLVSYSLGAKDYDKIKKYLFSSLILSGVICFVVFLSVLVAKSGIIGFFTDDAQLKNLTMTAMGIISFQYLVININIVVGSFYTAIERPVESVVIAIIRSVAFVIPLLFVLPSFLGDTGIWLSIPLAEMLTLFVSVPMITRTLKCFGVNR